MSRITGKYLANLFKQKVGFDYTVYFDPTKMNRLFEDGLMQCIEDRYKEKQDQKAKDEIVNFVSTNVVLSIVNNNSFYLRPLPIFAMTNVGTLVSATTLLPHNLVTGQTVTMSNIAGFTTNNPNGTFVVTVVSGTRFTYVASLAPTGAYTANTGQMVLVNGQLTNYWHALSVKGLFLKTIYAPPTITNASNTNPIVITLDTWNNFRTKDYINISGITGNTNANGNFYVKSLSQFTFALYTDINLQTPVAGNGVFGGIPVLSRVYERYCRPYMPDEKISTLNTPKEDSPRYEMGDGFIKVYPLSSTCTKVTIDYVKLPLDAYGNLIYIDSADDNFDVSLYYTEKLLNNMIDKCAIIMGGTSRDAMLQELGMEQAANNN